MNLLFSCIGRRGYLARWFREHLSPDDRIVGTSNTPWTSGFHACDRGVLMPDLVDPHYVPTLLEVCRDERIDGLLSFFDRDIDVLAAARDRFLAIGVTPILPTARVSHVTFDKLETARYLTAHGFRTPRTFDAIEPVTDGLADGTLRFPLVVKPRLGYASRSIAFVDDRTALEVAFGRDHAMLVQEHCGGDEFSLDVLGDLDGRVLSVVAKRKIAMRAGETDQAETVDDLELLRLGERLGETLRLAGPLDVDVFVDGGEIRVLELNPRFGGAYPAAHLAGADFPAKIIAMLRGEKLRPDIGAYAAGVSMMKDYAILPAYGGELTDARP